MNDKPQFYFDRFTPPLSISEKELYARSGQYVTVLRELSRASNESDGEYLIRFEDGFEANAFDIELTPFDIPDSECSLCKDVDCDGVNHKQTAVQYQRKLIASALELAVAHRDACESALYHSESVNDRIEYNTAQTIVRRLYARREALYRAQS